MSAELIDAKISPTHTSVNSILIKNKSFFSLSKSQGNLALFSCQEVNLAVFIAL